MLYNVQVDNIKKNPVTKSFMNRNKSSVTKFVEFIDSWKLQTALDKAEQAITQTRKLLRDSHISNQSSNDYKDYLERVKSNINIVLGKTDDANSPPLKVQKFE